MLFSATRSRFDVSDPYDEFQQEVGEQRVEDMRYVLSEPQLRIVQQLIANDHAALSPTELHFRNPSMTEPEIWDILHEMEDREPAIVHALEADEPVPFDVPETYFAVTEYGVELLKKMGLYEQVGLLYDVYEAVDRPDLIDRIEGFEGKPSPEWAQE